MKTNVMLTRKDQTVYLTFACDEPGKPATLDMAVLEEMSSRLDEIESDIADVRVVVVQSSSEKYFIVGANVNALETLNAETIIPWVLCGHKVFNRLEALPCPVIAKVEGFALGGGLELAMACDFIVASNRARFGQPEANLGFVAGWGGSYRLPRRVGVARAKEMFFTGQIVDAGEAYKIGLVNFVGEKDALEAHIAALAEKIGRCSPVAVAEMKKLLNRCQTITLEQSGMEEALASCICLSSGDTQARVSAFVESRKKKREK